MELDSDFQLFPNAYITGLGHHDYLIGGIAVSEQEVLYEVADGVATITINRPAKYNALNTSVVTTLREFFKKAEEDASVRAVVLTGAGEKAFGAGWICG